VIKLLRWWMGGLSVSFSGKPFREAAMRHAEEMRAFEAEHQREMDRLWLRAFGRESLTVIKGGRDAAD
jgi:hypothetical protein